MKKITCILICVLMLMTSMCIWVSATSENNAYSYEIDNTIFTVEFEDNNLSSEEQVVVAEKLIGLNNAEMQTYGLGCTLFGHDYKYTTVSVVQHKVNKYVPRCKKQTYDVTYCEDCDYAEETLKAINYIDCCPQD